MEAKDTVMSDEGIARVLGGLTMFKKYNLSDAITPSDRAVAKAQAEISFKAGREEKGNHILDTASRAYQEGIKEVVECIELLEPPIIKARDKVAFYAGYQRAKEDCQAKLKEWEIK